MAKMRYDVSTDLYASDCSEARAFATGAVSFSSRAIGHLQLHFGACAPVRGVHRAESEGRNKERACKGPCDISTESKGMVKRFSGAVPLDDPAENSRDAKVDDQRRWTSPAYRISS